MDKLILETCKYETQLNMLARIKVMYETGHHSYFAGTLLTSVNDLVNGGCVSIDITPINNIENPIDREIQYYASEIYRKFKGPNCSFFKQAMLNIKAYKAEKCYE